MTTSSTFPTYTYTQLPPDHIRLLKIESIDGDDLTCSLHPYTINVAPTYRAISYAWGTQPFTSQILISTPSSTSSSSSSPIQSIPISPHLHSGLLTISRHFISTSTTPPKALYIFCDAICINQQDSNEKSSQVSLMHVIFSSAFSVLIYLGISSSNSSLALSAISKYNDTILTLPRMIQDDRVYSQYGLPFKRDPIWPALLHLYNRSWIQRLWVVQEVILAKHLLVFIGDKIISWEKFSAFGMAMSRADIVTPMVAEYDPIWPGLGSQTEGFTALSGLISLTNLWNSPSPERQNLVFSEAINYGRSRKCKEPVDKVYALLGLAINSNSIFREEIAVTYEEDIRKEYWRVYVSLSKVFAKTEGDLTILRQASSKERPKEMPSWCPNLNSIRETYLLSFRYSAGGHSEGEYQPGDRLKNPVEYMDSNPLAISILGSQVDTIKSILPHFSFSGFGTKENHSPPHSMSKNLLHWLEQYQSLITSLNPNDPDKAFEIFWRSLCGDLDKDSDGDEYFPASLEQQYNFSYAVQWLEECRDGIPSHSFLEISRHRAAEAWLDQISKLWRERSFFTTEAGRVGFGVRNVRPGDKVCIFFTSPTIHLLRKRESGGSYEFISDGYLYGMMNGEALELIRTGELKEERFVLD